MRSPPHLRRRCPCTAAHGTHRHDAPPSEVFDRHTLVALLEGLRAQRWQRNTRVRVRKVRRCLAVLRNGASQGRLKEQASTGLRGARRRTSLPPLHLAVRIARSLDR
eukprot:1984776-Prymnesium_polylepis.1